MLRFRPTQQTHGVQNETTVHVRIVHVICLRVFVHPHVFVFSCLRVHVQYTTIYVATQTRSQHYAGGASASAAASAPAWMLRKHNFIHLT